MKVAQRTVEIPLLVLLMAQCSHAQIMPPLLPGADGGLGTVGVTDYFVDEPVGEPAFNVGATLDDILSGSVVPIQMSSAQYTTTDVADTGFYPDGGPAVTGVPNDYPGGGGDDFISVMKGAFQVPESGTYTIQVRSDDGFALRVNGAEFTTVTGNGAIDPEDPQTIFHDTNTFDSNTRGVVDLSAGVHTFDAFMWNSIDGAFMEISSAKGQFPYHQAAWLPIGDSSTVPEQARHPIAKLTGPMFVGNLNDAFDQELDLERENLLAAQLAGTLDDTDDTITTFHIDDNEFALNCPFVENPQFHAPDTTFQWPNTDGDIDNFSSIITGSFMIDDGDEQPGETMPISFHIDSDGRSSFRVIGQDFSDVMDNELVELEGDDAMFANRGVCNTNYTGVITLTEGVEYDFESIHVEGSGNAGMQLLAAPGDQLDDFDPSAFVVVGTEAFVIPSNTGFALVDPSGGIAGDYNNNGILDSGDLDVHAQFVSSGDLAGDLDGDGDTDDSDRIVWVEQLQRSWLGDSNFDGEFNSGDFVAVFTVGKYEQDEMATYAEGDWNGDTQFTSGDFVAAFTHGGYEMGLRPDVAPVPEPTGTALLMLVTLTIIRKKRMAKQQLRCAPFVHAQ